jgi:hypothetical protein
MKQGINLANSLRLLIRRDVSGHIAGAWELAAMENEGRDAFCA